MERNSSKILFVLALLIITATVIGMVLIRDKAVDTDVTAKTTRVGLIIAGKKDDANFCQVHYDALMSIKDELNLEIICKENVPEDESALSAARELIDIEKCRFIIGASLGYEQYLAEAAREHPEVCFLHFNGSQSLSNMSSFMGRMYQARYLSGIVAGMRTQSGQTGYVAAYPNSEVICGINAFAQGVRSVRPDAQIFVKYCYSWVDDEAARKATEELLDNYPDIDVLSMHTNSIEPNYVAEQRGVYSVGFNKDNRQLFPGTYLTACEWNLGPYYRQEILSCLQGKFSGKIKWMDMDTGVVGISALTKNVAPGTKEAIDSANELFVNNRFDVFYGPVTDNTGAERVPEGESMSDDYMLVSFDWYVEGVIVEE